MAAVQMSQEVGPSTSIEIHEGEEGVSSSLPLFPYDIKKPQLCGTTDQGLSCFSTMWIVFLSRRSEMQSISHFLVKKNILLSYVWVFEIFSIKSMRQVRSCS